MNLQVDATRVGGRATETDGEGAAEGGASEDEPFDVLTTGRVGVDLYPLQSGVGLEDVTTFGKFLGGTATNVAVAAARLGRRAAVITRTGADPFGVYVHKALRALGVDDRWVSAVAELPTPVTFCELFPPDRFPLYFYRTPTAPDLQIRPDDLDLAAIRAARVFWVTATGLSQEPSRSAVMAALAARGRRRLTVLDLDHRPQFWPSMADARREVTVALEQVTVAVGNVEECEVATGTRDARAAAAALLGRGLDLAVVKRGPDGVLARDHGAEVSVPAAPIAVVNGLGAGDAFGGALCHGLLAEWPLDRCLRFANTAGAIVASRLACAQAMPTAEEIDAVMGAGQRV